MSLTNAEFEAILADDTKVIEGDITWVEDEDHSPSVEFRAEVLSQPGWALFVRGSINTLAGTLTFALILKTEGRIYALDLGKDHHNPSCQRVGEKHKHTWTETSRDKEAYAPTDITAVITDPLAVWLQFCKEARIDHRGMLHSLPARQQEVFR